MAIFRASRIPAFILLALAAVTALAPPILRGAAAPSFKPLAAQSPPPATARDQSTYNLRDFVAELRRIDASLRSAQKTREALAGVRTALPTEWHVDAPGHEYTISTEPLRSLLLDAERNASQRDARLADAEMWLEHLSSECDDASPPAAQGRAAARNDLNSILSRREFAAVRPPNAWDLFKQKIQRWFLRLIEKLFGNIARHPLGAEVLFWLVIAGAIAWLAMMLFRYWSGHARMDEMQSVEVIPTRRTWQEWIRAARLAADRGDFREAVHSAYWAGIAYLENLNVIAVDRARTPREYLRLVDELSEGLPSDRAKRRESLSALTSRLERIWYGLRPARSEDFEDSLRQLKELGCRWQ